MASQAWCRVAFVGSFLNIGRAVERPRSAQPLAIDEPEFRRIFGHWATGVAIVAARHAGGRPCGLTANAVASLSLDPPLVLVCIDRTADSHDCIASAGAFTVNVLDSGQERLARRFAELENAEEKFEGVAYRAGQTGAPILEEALAWVECRIRETHDGGDHTIFIGEVVAGDAREGEPLIFYRGGYGRHAP